MRETNLEESATGGVVGAGRVGSGRIDAMRAERSAETEGGGERGEVYALEPRGEIPEDESEAVVFACRPQLSCMVTGRNTCED